MIKSIISKVNVSLLLLFIASGAQAKSFDYAAFSQEYFAAWQQVQSPKATKQDLEHYLSLLTDDVGYQHLPYAANDTREADGKKMLRKGMSYYLGIHTEYQVKLTNSAFGHNVIMIEYHTQAKGIHPDNGQEIIINNTAFEVLEIENGKISVIRHYSK